MLLIASGIAEPAARNVKPITISGTRIVTPLSYGINNDAFSKVYYPQIRGKLTYLWQ